MAKEIVYSEQARSELREGMELLANTIKVTLGPRGREVAIEKKWGAPVVTNDGATIAKELEIDKPLENVGVQLLREVCKKTQDEAGDGTTTAAVIAQAIYREGYKDVAAGANAAALRRGIEKAVARVVDELKRMSQKVETYEDTKRVATLAAKNDEFLGKLIADALDKVGADGAITVEEAKGTETQLEIVEGMRFDRGYLSPYFLTKPETMEAELEEPYILIHDKKISAVKDILPVLEQVAKTGKSLLVIAEDVEGEALATLVVNKVKGTLRCAAVKAPGYGDRRKAMLQDIAILTGGRVISEEVGLKLENVRLEDLGRAERVIIDKDNTTIVGGKGKKEEIEGRVKSLKAQLEETTSDWEREKLQERISRLSGGVAVLRIGAPTEIALKELKARAEDALAATRAALEEGILPGGGVAYLRAAPVLDELEKEVEGDEKLGVRILRRALSAPLRQLAENAGWDGAVVYAKVREGTGNYGFDVEREAFVDMVEAGILDPTKVLRVALQNGASVSSVLVMTEAVVVEKPKEEKKSKTSSTPEY
ncbi:MAG: chaperonin GroEL [Calditrichaeota bacterium]|nr:chaperonin GroEL [Calditrichota bacterium]